MNSFYPLATSTWDDNELNAMKRVIDNGVFTMGPEIKAFETAFSEFINCQYCVMVNSGSSANLLMVAACFYTQPPLLKPGDEVIVPAVSWSTTYFPLHQYGINLKFVDIEPNTLNIDIDIVQSAISKNTRAIFAVNLLGNPADHLRLLSVCEEHNLILLEDNCESLGAKLDNKFTGTFGLMGSFSSFFSHHISTMEGGIIATDNEELYHILLSLRSHGWTRHLPEYNHVSGYKSENSFEESFRFVLPGYNLRPLELSGAIGIEQLKKLPDLITGRRNNAEYFKNLFSNHTGFEIQKEFGESSWFGFAIVVNKNLNRNQILSALSDAGIEYRPIVAGNFTKNPVIRFINHTIHGELVNADRIDRYGFFVGNHHYGIRNQLNHLYEVLSRFL